jgi:hypothetical protein
MARTAKQSDEQTKKQSPENTDKQDVSKSNTFLTYSFIFLVGIVLGGVSINPSLPLVNVNHVEKQFSPPESPLVEPKDETPDNTLPAPVFIPNQTSFVYIADGVFSDKFCESIIAKFEKQRSRQRDGLTGSGTDNSKKKSRDISITQYKDWLPEIEKINEIILAEMVKYALEYPYLMMGAMSPSVNNKKYTPGGSEPKMINLVSPQLFAEYKDEIPALVASLFRLHAAINVQVNIGKLITIT